MTGGAIRQDGFEGRERVARAEGFRALVVMATVPGEPPYRAFEFRRWSGSI